jgi:hypothetical protein
MVRTRQHKRRVKAKIVALSFLLLAVLINHWNREISKKGTGDVDLIKTNPILGHLPRNENDGFCRELIESAEFIIDMKETPSWKVHMIQLVGKYTGKKAFLGETAEHNYRHNSRMLHPHNIKSTPVRDPVKSIPDGLSPAFWKMDAVKHHCTRGDYDLVLFLDGDTSIMDPYARVEFLWAYHTELARVKDHISSIDMLFNGDRSDINSGIFIVNCTSKTAMRTLKIWKEVALMLARNKTALVEHSWFEQNAIHLMTRTQKWLDHGSLRWNDIVSQYTDKVDTYSTEALRKRIRVTTQCALNTYVWEVFGKRNHSECFVYKPGHFILHMAGVPAKKKRALMDTYRGSTKPSSKPLTLRQAARSYLNHHSFRFDRTLAYDDWKIMLDWNHVWPEARR